MAAPTRDVLLAPYSTNWDTRLTASPTTYNLTAADAAAYTALHDPYIEAWNNVVAAREAKIFSSPLVAIKNSAKAALLPHLRQMYKQVQADLTVPDSAKLELGIHIIDSEKTLIPPPAVAPQAVVEKVENRLVTLTLADALDPTSGRKPEGVQGAVVFACVGSAPLPEGDAGWQWQGQTGRLEAKIQFDNSVPGAAQVWFCVLWYNARGTGPACIPITTFLGKSVADVG